MEFDLVIANPPYNIGTSIISGAIEHLTDNGIASVLMPLSCYKKKELYRHVETFELANPKLFEDAVITYNLCVASLSKEKVDKYSWDTMQFSSFDKAYREVYIYNKLKNYQYAKYLGQPSVSTKDLFNWNNTFVCSIRAADHGCHIEDNSLDMKYNLAKSYINIDDLQRPTNATSRYTLSVIRFSNRDSVNNFCKFWYQKSKDNLMSKLIFGLKKRAGSIQEAIPQIDWEHISDTGLWDRGLYDDAVLAEMHLKWNEDKTRIVQA